MAILYVIYTFTVFIEQKVYVTAHINIYNSMAIPEIFSAILGLQKKQSTRLDKTSLCQAGTFSGV